MEKNENQSNRFILSQYVNVVRSMKNKRKIIDEIIYYVEEAIAQMDDNGLSKMKDIQVNACFLIKN